MTIYDYHMTMNEDEVGIADLKARLSEFLRLVRKGHAVTVLDRGRPVARIVPYEREVRLQVRRAAGKYERLADIPLPEPVDLDFDVLDVLREERQSYR